MLRKIVSASPQTYLVLLAVFAGYTAVVGGYGYHRGALSKAEKIGNLESDVRIERAANKTCMELSKEQTDTFERMRQDSERRAEEARRAAEEARLLADDYKKKAISMAQRAPSKNCSEAANKLREQLRIERNSK